MVVQKPGSIGFDVSLLRKKKIQDLKTLYQRF